MAFCDNKLMHRQGPVKGNFKLNEFETRVCCQITTNLI